MAVGTESRKSFRFNEWLSGGFGIGVRGGAAVESGAEPGGSELYTVEGERRGGHPSVPQRDEGGVATGRLPREDREGVWGGELALGPEGKLATFLGKRRPGLADAQVGPRMMFTGVHVISPRLLDRVPPQGEQCIVRTAYRALFETEQGIDAWVHRGYWWEHSTIERYLEGLANVLEGRVALPWAEQPLVGIDPSAELGPGVELVQPVRIGANARIGAGAKLGPCVEIGAGAQVAAGVRVERSCVWPGAKVEADAVATVVA